MKKHIYIILFSIIFTVIFLPVFSAFAHGIMGYGDDDYGIMGYGMMGYGILPFGWIGFILMAFFWVLIAVIIFAVARWVVSALSHKDESRNSALDILKERYAKGEINKEEFEDKKRDLS